MESLEFCKLFFLIYKITFFVIFSLCALRFSSKLKRSECPQESGGVVWSVFLALARYDCQPENVKENYISTLFVVARAKGATAQRG